MEARWAVWLDAAHLPWLYEPSGFEFADGSSYIPDFFLPGQRCYLEVKPSRIDANSANKAIKLAVETETNVFVSIGPPSWAHDLPEGQLIRFTPLAQTFTGYRFASCDRSGRVGITEDGRLDQLSCGSCQHAAHELGHTTGRLFTATMIARLWEFKR